VLANNLHPDGISVAAAARLLGVSRQAIEQRVETRMATIPGTSPRLLSRSLVANEVATRLREARKRVENLERSAKDLAITHAPGAVAAHDLDPITEPGAAHDHVSSLAELQRELEVERTGRALAEQRINSLRQDLRRANFAIDALKPQPDFDPDRPISFSQ
jgi:hypothetical protein